MATAGRDRLTKAQVETLLAAIDGPLPELLVAIERAVDVLHPGEGLDAVLRRLGRAVEADALAAGDEQTAWDLAIELNEQRRL